MAVEQQRSALPPAQPTYIFRGHSSQIHSVQIIRSNRQLLTGDADGWIVVWKLESKRPLAVWKAHEGAILGTAEWEPDRIITHGRDNTLRIWKLAAIGDGHLSTVLPVEDTSVHRPKPWLLHTLPVNTLNFCSFSMCFEEHTSNGRQSSTNSPLEQKSVSSTRLSDSILVAVPARDDHKIEIYRFPEERLVYLVPRIESTDTGMVMTVKLTYHRPSNNLIVLAGYEGGFTAVHLLGYNSGSTIKATTTLDIQRSQLVYLSKPHSQPLLSLDVVPDATSYFTSSADAIVAKHSIPGLPAVVHVSEPPPNTSLLEGTDFESRTNVPTSQIQEAVPGEPFLDPRLADPGPGQQDRINDVEPRPISHGVDQQHGASGSTGLDSDLRIGSTFADTQAGIEPLTFSKRAITVQATSSNDPGRADTTKKASSLTANRPSGLSSLLSKAAPQATLSTASSFRPNTTAQPAQKSVQTKHAGQQSLNVRSDGRLFVTGGWDSRVRIYSTKTLKELAVLKWHKEGVYATHFGIILETKSTSSSTNEGEASVIQTADSSEVARTHSAISGLTRLQHRREEQIQAKHWVVAGAKDGKVSLWEVF